MTTRSSRSRSTRSSQKVAASKTDDVLSTETTIESPPEEASPVITEDTSASKAPVNIELNVSDEPQTPAPAATPEKIQTDVRERLAKKTAGDNIFVPTTPAALEKAAEQVAQEQGFEFNRGTSIGARLIARAQKRV